MPDTDRPSPFSLAAFGLAVLLGGSNFLAVRFSNRDLDPFWGAGLRFSLAAVIFVLIALGLRLRWPRGRQLVSTAVFGLLNLAVFYALMYWALVRVEAGTATVVLAVVPLVTLLLAAAHGLERIRGRALAGSLLAIAGIAWMFVGPGGVDLPLPGLLALLGAALCVGESVILGKRLSANHPVMTNAVAMSVGAPVLLVLSALAGDNWVLPTRAEAVWSLVYLVTLGSVGLFVLMLLVIRHWTASASSYLFVLFPLVTMFLGSALGDESLSLQGVTGALVVMAGVWFGALSPRAATPGPAPRVGEPLLEQV